ncbi:MAG: transketolase [Candidatus Vogelbacteria bacterium CG10_big_fil_rev_8_21_14_0_10_49_38]|uniref:Transketolase n=1 Tax=Candidatus Vogelbacteria bacterium CG10_big_fil_rev_8_21_14_0_10_49_38 TaxID=1975043 RepID=A0A2H0RJY5_9BACT|nr:MAG: transketolase [bacterium CG10_49_38]PIR46085.1 MAG: transketolase [Candidatus Vogelbacteria bacterium CG10_big_fil_rev_8_21_14_0_10_49_38]
MILTNEKKKYLAATASKIRRSVIEMLVEAGSGHTAGPLGMADIFTALYFGLLKHDPKRFDWPESDRLVLSNGHICPVLYATLAEAGHFEKKELSTLRRYGSRLQGHPHREFLPFLETSSGPLGEGLSQAVGMALADRMDRGRVSGRFFYCLMSDGELQEGQTWEAVMLAGKERPHNLIAILDRNNIQIDGHTEEVMPVEPVRAKWEAFGWHVLEIDGHNFEEIFAAVGQAKSVFNRPTMIIAHTTPGKGVVEFEGRYEWHGKPPSKKEGEQALKELRTLSGRLKHED